LWPFPIAVEALAITGIAMEKESAENATEKLCPKLDFSLR
jgi:hypothetical protein